MTLPVSAQFISPGQLSKPHSFLEGISNCTSCHELRNPEITNEKCESCHTPIKESIIQGEGFHAQPEVIQESCASCHKEHFGLEFDVLRFDSTDFDHALVGFVLDGNHEDLSCASCHSEQEYLVDSTFIAYQERFELNEAHETFLGLDQNCVSCHKLDSPHANQFLDESCSSCHSTEQWETAELFDHDTSQFPLTGAHIEVSCESCHEPNPILGDDVIQYVNLEFETCESCHEDDHEGRLDNIDGMETTCETCHITDDWHLFTEDFPESEFPHEETGYALLGAHLNQDCQSCHDPRSDELIENSFQLTSVSYTYPEPISEDCESCHVDYHEGVFQNPPYEQSCESCHNLSGWYPTTFGLSEHNINSTFSLIGAHVVTPCFACHQNEETNHELVFRFDDQSCNSCHEADNPHGEVVNNEGVALSADCSTCHNETKWSKTSTFDHLTQTGYALTGAHEAVSCRSCHFDENTTFALLDTDDETLGVDEILENVTLGFSIDNTSCQSCHEVDSPHKNQFISSFRGPECESCHITDSFTMESFNHDQTGFPLDGAHQQVSCKQCHATETASDSSLFVRFFPLSTECASCHGQ